MNWSVIIPVYEPSEFLELTLRSVLEQDRGPSEMEIVVIDDCSPTVDVQQMIRELSDSRVRYVRNTHNLGLAGNWNAGIEQSRGEWIHILHQDDVVLPGFYANFEELSSNCPAAGVMLTRHQHISGTGESIWTSHLERETPGMLDDWIRTIAREQRVQFAAVAIRRSVFETVGGFRSDLNFVLDWEMWVRMTSRGIRWAYSPETAAQYRLHAESESSRIQSTGADVADAVAGIRVVKNLLPPELQDQAGAKVLGYAVKLLREAIDTNVAGFRLRRAWNLCGRLEEVYGSGAGRRAFRSALAKRIKSYVTSSEK